MKKIIGNVCLYRSIVKNIDKLSSKITSNFEYLGVKWSLYVAPSLEPSEGSSDDNNKSASGSIRIWLGRSDVKLNTQNTSMENSFPHHGRLVRKAPFASHEINYSNKNDLSTQPVAVPKGPVKVWFEISFVKQLEPCKTTVIGSGSCTFDCATESPESIVSYDFINDPEYNFKKNESVVLQVRISKNELVEENEELISSCENSSSNSLKTAELIEARFNYVYFDVGGYFHMCHSSTLLKFPDSMLANQIKPEFDTRKHERDFIKIDRDGAQMGLILNYMRDPINFTLTQLSTDQIRSLKQEADFYCLQTLVDLCDYYTRKRRPTRRSALVVIDKDAMIEHLSLCTKPAIVLNFDLPSSIIREMIKYCDESKFNVFCYNSNEWFDGGFIAYLYDPITKICFDRTQSKDELALMKFILNANDYVF